MSCQQSNLGTYFSKNNQELAENMLDNNFLSHNLTVTWRGRKFCANWDQLLIKLPSSKSKVICYSVRSNQIRVP